jgi:hypothetical protein
MGALAYNTVGTLQEWEPARGRRRRLSPREMIYPQFPQEGCRSNVASNVGSQIAQFVRAA